jgi:hypothetical protein
VTRKIIEDQYGQQVEVEVVMSGDETTVALQITERVPTPPPAPLKYRTNTRHSKLTPEQARNLATQLNEAADEIDPVAAA